MIGGEPDARVRVQVQEIGRGVVQRAARRFLLAAKIAQTEQLRRMSECKKGERDGMRKCSVREMRKYTEPERNGKKQIDFKRFSQQIQ